MKQTDYDEDSYFVGTDGDREITVFPNIAGTITLVAEPDDDNVPPALTPADVRDLAALLLKLADEAKP